MTKLLRNVLFGVARAIYAVSKVVAHGGYLLHLRTLSPDERAALEHMVANSTMYVATTPPLKAEVPEGGTVH